MGCWPCYVAPEICLSSKPSLCRSCTNSKAICFREASGVHSCPFPGKTQGRHGEEQRGVTLQGGGQRPEEPEEPLGAEGRASSRPGLCPCLTAPPSPAWSLPLLGQQYLDILTAWYCSFQDCCAGGDCRISNNLTGLQSDLSVRLHGQHLARELVLTTVREYLALPQPDRALALSFHGWSGTGKNFVAQMLAENLYRDGLRSDCVKVLTTMLHFPHAGLVGLYKEQLLEQVRETQQRCRQTLFVLDEAEKLHPALLEALGSHLERWTPENHGAESSRTIFLFLSNLGGDAINEVVLELLQAGRPREEVTMGHLESRLQAELAASTDSGFGHSRLVTENLINVFVPFLPLEYLHVRLCARDAFLSLGLPHTEEMLDEIARMMVYVPKEEQRFSSQGCKSIAQRISYFLP